MTESDQVKAALAALADGEARDASRMTDGSADPELPTETSPERWGRADYRTVIERASRATDDVDAAASFVETVGVDTLERAVERAEHEVSGLAEEGRTALAAFERFRAAADGDGRGE
ncbi:hypothetical protein NDI85_06250 [Halomicroarcula sp. S1AR25-4]|uniref:hypothetical protein n=1 Tax=unclassified Haloarcula TaxID=2624677 RepID=UPI00140EE415|nr:hypothetical protein [Halomicroarcula sp. S1AR25-4]MDS0277387.1 hypothetical protein [Halomicroarcula sp. S1AR25-4]QIO22235.1 hypothetical protein G9465_07715 [Haloarcula sp. JP-L23]